MTLGLHVGALGVPLGTRGVDVHPLVSLWDGALESLGHLLRKASKKVPNMRGMGTQSGDIFNNILSFRGMDYLRLDCTGMSGLEFRPLLVDLWACLLGPSVPCWQEHRFEGPGQEGGAQGLTSCGPLWRAVAACCGRVSPP